MYKRNYNSYTEYIEHQRSKTERNVVQTTLRGRWNKDREKFIKKFACLEKYGIIEGEAVCLGSRLGCEVEILQEMGFKAIGIDLVPFPPYTIKADFHNTPFNSNSIDLIFSNSVDHVKDLDKFKNEIKRVLKPEGYVLLDITFGSFGSHESLRIDNIEELMSVFSDFSIVYTENYNKQQINNELKKYKHSLENIYHTLILLRLTK